MKQILDDKKADLSAMRAKATERQKEWTARETKMFQCQAQTEAETIELKKCVSRLRRDKKWVLEEGIPLIFDAIKLSDDYVDKLLDLAIAVDAHGHSDGLAAGYEWAKKVEPLEKHSDYECNTVDGVKTA